MINYQVDYINPSGLNNYQVRYQSLLTFNKAPHISSTKINDTTLHISLNVLMDTGFYKVYEHLPQSVSVMITTNDSLGNCKEDMTSFYITRDALSGINQINYFLTESIKIYPNPAANEVHLQAGSVEKLTVQLFDITGKQLTENISFTNSTTINLQELSQGIYFIRITDTNSGSMNIQKVVIER